MDNEERRGQLIVVILIFMTIFYFAAILRKLDYRRFVEQRRTNHFISVIGKLVQGMRNKIKRLLSTFKLLSKILPIYNVIANQTELPSFYLF